MREAGLGLGIGVGVSKIKDIIYLFGKALKFLGFLQVWFIEQNLPLPPPVLGT